MCGGGRKFIRRVGAVVAVGGRVAGRNSPKGSTGAEVGTRKTRLDSILNLILVFVGGRCCRNSVTWQGPACARCARRSGGTRRAEGSERPSSPTIPQWPTKRPQPATGKQTRTRTGARRYARGPPIFGNVVRRTCAVPKKVSEPIRLLSSPFVRPNVE